MNLFVYLNHYLYKGVLIVKHGKKPTVKQSKILEQNGYIAADWLIIKSMVTRLEIVNRNTGIINIVPK